MSAGERDLADRHNPATGSSSRDAAAISCRAWHTGGNNPAINNADPTRNRVAEPISDRLDPPDPSERRYHWVIKVDDHHPIVGNAFCEEALDGAVGANRAVAIEMINSDVRKDTNIEG
jgi:hypothetical protein